MRIIIFGKDDESKKLFNLINSALEELGLNDFIELEETNDDKYKEKIDFKKTPALLIEEESIDFIDVLFEGIIPSEDEIKEMIVSIIGGRYDSNCNLEICGTSCNLC